MRNRKQAFAVVRLTLVAVSVIGTTATSFANAAYYRVTVHNETKAAITVKATNVKCASIDAGGPLVIAPDATGELKFYRSGSCGGQQGNINVSTTGDWLPTANGSTPDNQGFTYDSNGGLQKCGVNSKYASVLEWTARDNDNAYYNLYVIARVVPLSEYYTKLRSKLGPAGQPVRVTDPAQFPTRQDIGVSKLQPLLFDIGGEGYHEAGVVTAGFKKAININDKNVDSQPPHGTIPNLIWVKPWDTNPSYPVADQMGTYVVMQNAPLTDKGVSEIARITAIGGKIGLWIDDTAEHQRRVTRLAQLVGGAVTDSRVAGSGCRDEFRGRAGYPKLCITRLR
jgi:hypothetical protein